MSKLVFPDDGFFKPSTTTPKPVKFGVKEGLCLTGELYETLNSCLRYFTEEKALGYVKNYFQNKKENNKT